MSASRVGAIPPYNDLLGGKLVALAATSDEVRRDYSQKYSSRLSLMKGRMIPSRLLFITTTSAFGRSSLYNRLQLGTEAVAERIGTTRGAGSFQIPDWLYRELLDCLSESGVDIQRGYGHGPSRKMRLIATAFDKLGLRDCHYHGIRRELFLMSLAANLPEVIAGKEPPRWVQRPFAGLFEYWMNRWCIPRAGRCAEWRAFDRASYFDNQVPELLAEAELWTKSASEVGGDI
jgi:hypothetical protein